MVMIDRQIDPRKGIELNQGERVAYPITHYIFCGCEKGVNYQVIAVDDIYAWQRLANGQSSVNIAKIWI